MMECWFTGLLLDLRQRQVAGCSWNRALLLRTFTREHLVPQSSQVLDDLDPLLQSRNVVPASLLVNSMIGNAPLGVKVLLRDMLMAMHLDSGRMTMQRADAVAGQIRGFLAEWKLHGRYIWDDGRVDQRSGGRVAFFSTANPAIPITAQELDQRNRKLRTLRSIEETFVAEHFGAADLSQDLSMSI